MWKLTHIKSPVLWSRNRSVLPFLIEARDGKLRLWLRTNCIQKFICLQFTLKKYIYLYSSEKNYIPNFELIGSLWNSVEYIRRKYKTKYRNFGAAFAVNCQDKAGSKCSICITFFTIYPYRYGTSTNPGCSVSDPYRYSMNPDPYPAKNLIPDPEDPWIRIRIQAIS